MRSLLFSFVILFASASHAAHAADTAAPSMRYDHFNPVVLNEFALQKYRDGDARSALILLERANLLAPHDARIRRNLDMLRAQRDGKPFVEAVTAQVKSEDDVSSTLATQVSGLEQAQQLPLEPLWKKPGQ